MASPARVAADVAAVLPSDDPLGLLARQRLAAAAREARGGPMSGTSTPLTYYGTPARTTEQARAERTAEIVGDGAKITAEQFARLDARERNHLLEVNPDRYRELRDAELSR